MVYQVSWNLPGNFLHFHHTACDTSALASSIRLGYAHVIAELQMLLCMTSRPTLHNCALTIGHFGQPEAKAESLNFSASTAFGSHLL